MDLMPDDDLSEIERTVSGFLAARMPVTGLGHQHTTVGPELDAAVWRECADLGWLALGLPEAAGGAGCSLVEEAVLFRELGRHVTPGPFLPTVLAGHAAVAAGDAGLAAAITRGEALVAMAAPTSPVQLGDSTTVEMLAMHADGAEYVLLCDRSGVALLRASDCRLRAVDSIDGSVRVAHGRADGARPVVHAPGSGRDRALVLAAAMSVGLAHGVLSVAVDYARQRQQFGKPIGAYQAVKHPLADSAVRAEGADAQVAYAAVAVRDELPGASVDALVAKWAADDAAVRNAATAVQVHGGIGFTAEATPYRYVLRSHVMSRLIASRRELLDEIVRA